MNIKTSQPYPGDFVAIDDDTYDGAPDSNCPIGNGRTAQEAVIDLVEQIIERLEEKIDLQRTEIRALRAELKGASK